MGEQFTAPPMTAGGITAGPTDPAGFGWCNNAVIPPVAKATAGDPMAGVFGLTTAAARISQWAAVAEAGMVVAAIGIGEVAQTHTSHALPMTCTGTIVLPILAAG